MTDRRLVGLALGAEPSEALLALCRDLGRRAALVDAGDLPGGRGPLLRRLGDPARAVGDPAVVWVDTAGAVDRDGDALRDAALVVGDDPQVLALAAAAGATVRIVPAAGAWSAAVPVAPFVRARVRAARGIGGRGTLVHHVGVWTFDRVGAIAGDALETALALASAVVVHDPQTLVGALAWGCPAVTDARTAAAAGARPDVHCVLGADGTAGAADTAAAHDLAATLARDEVLAARLSWAGRVRYERHHSLRHAGDDVLVALGLPGRWAPSTLERQLERLDSHRGPLAWARESATVAGIVPGPREGTT